MHVKTEIYCEDLERFPAFKCIGPDTVHILVSRKAISWDMLIFAVFFLLFFLLVELLILTDNVPRAAMLMPSPLLLASIVSLGMWLKWQKTGQIVAIDRQNRLLTIKEWKANLIPSTRRIDFDKIEGFSVVPYTVYRSQGGGGTYSTPHTRGYCVAVKFVKQRLFLFIEKDTPALTIGGYLQRDEAALLRTWLNQNIF